MVSFPSSSDLLRAFFQLSYPVPTPTNPDSFPNSSYYSVGPLDACFIISSLAVFALAREIVRLRIMTPFANKLLFGHSKGWQSPSKRSKLTGNGHAHPNGLVSNGNGTSHYAARKISAKNRVRERNVIRFAEQGWTIVYCTIWWCFGLVSLPVYVFFQTSFWTFSTSTCPSIILHGVSITSG
jgi:acyl-CoA-dependent ceramide synthase